MTKAFRYIYKLLLNSLYGVMGSRQHNRIIRQFGPDQLDELAAIQSKQLIHNEFKIGDYIFIDYEVSHTTGKESMVTHLSEENINFSNVVISSHITAKARIHMDKLMRKLRKDGYVIYYTDTDSIFIDKPISGNLLGSEIGKLKQEYTIIKDAYFLAPKSHGLKLANDTKIKYKGFNSGSIKWDNLKNYYDNGNFAHVPQTRIVSSSRFTGLRESVQNHKASFEYNKGIKKRNAKLK